MTLGPGDHIPLVYPMAGDSWANFGVIQLGTIQVTDRGDLDRRHRESDMVGAASLYQLHIGVLAK